MSVRFETRDIGSLAKPPWRVKAFAGRELELSDMDHARSWGERLGITGYEELVTLLDSRAGQAAELPAIDDWAARYAIALLEHAGLDVVWDGEQRRTEMYDHAIRHASGFEARGTVRSFDNKYYQKAACVGAPSVDEPYDVDEYRFVASHANRQLKVPFTGAYTLVDWSSMSTTHRGGASARAAPPRLTPAGGLCATSRSGSSAQTSPVWLPQALGGCR